MRFSIVYFNILETETQKNVFFKFIDGYSLSGSDLNKKGHLFFSLNWIRISQFTSNFKFGFLLRENSHLILIITFMLALSLNSSLKSLGFALGIFQRKMKRYLF